MKLVNFVSKAGPHLASHRMRCEIPSRIINERSTEISSAVTSFGSPKYDVNVFSKHFAPQEMFDEVYHCKDKGSKVVFDICDNHFNRDAKIIYERMCQLADLVTCNTFRMKEKIKQHTGRDAEIISDPITFPLLTPRVFTHGKPPLLFFGHSSNLKPLFDLSEELKDYEVYVISNLPDRGSKENFTFIPWDLGGVEAVIHHFPVVVIPTKGLRFWTKEKSPNRAVDAIHSGCFVITDSPEIYGELEPYIYLGNIVDGLRYYEEHNKEIYNKIRDGQKFVSDKYSHEVIYNQWTTALTKVL